MLFSSVDILVEAKVENAANNYFFIFTHRNRLHPCMDLLLTIDTITLYFFLNKCRSRLTTQINWCNQGYTKVH